MLRAREAPIVVHRYADDCDHPVVGGNRQHSHATLPAVSAMHWAAPISTGGETDDSMAALGFGARGFLSVRLRESEVGMFAEWVESLAVWIT